MSSIYATKPPLATIAEIEVLPSCRDGWVTVKPAPYGKLLPRAQKPFPAEWDGLHTQCDVTGPVALDTTGVVVEVGYGALQFIKGQRVMLMPSQSSDDFESNQNHKKWTLMEPEASISLHNATYLAALAIAHYAFFHISPFRTPDSVLIISCTPVLLFPIQLSNLQNASQTIVIERHPVLKKLAAAFGATHVLDPNDMDVPESVRLLTEDTGADIVFYITDQPNTQMSPDEPWPSTSLQHNPGGMNTAAYSAISACRSRGTIVNIAPPKIYDASKSALRNELMQREVQYMGSAGYDRASLEAAVTLMERGDVNTDGLWLDSCAAVASF